MKFRLYPAWILFLLSPAIGELLSASAPPAEFFQPIAFAMLSILYGGGALLIREFVIGRRLGWPAILLLGAAYGVAEEGLMCKSFFDPAWMDLGILGVYGRAFSVNWVWAAFLTTYHAIFSIAIPIALAHLTFPDRAGQRWLSNRKFLILLIIWILDGVFIFFAVSKFRPPMGNYLVALGLVILSIPLALRLPASFGPPHKIAGIRPIRFGLIGFFGTVVLFVIGWVLPNSRIPPAGTIAILAVMIALWSWMILRWSGNGIGWNDRHRFALLAGALAVFIMMGPLLELDKKAKDNRSGMWLVALVALILLIRLWIVLGRRRDAMLDIPNPSPANNQ